MTVNLSWIADINVTINTTALQGPSFKGMVMGVFPVASLPTSWAGSLVHQYGSNAEIVADFTPLYDAAIVALDYVQAYKYAILLKACSTFFTQTPTSDILYVSCLDNTAAINYVTGIQAIVDADNGWYAFYLADQVTSTQLTQNNGVYDAINSLTSNNNLKVGFFDTNDPVITAGNFLYDSTQAGKGISRAILFYLPTNPVSTTVTTALAVVDTLAAANMGKYFTNLFDTGIGLKSISGTQLNSVTIDSTITKTQLGDAGLGTGFLEVNGNVYPSFGASGLGLMQYGLMASSNSSALLYLDQIVGADFIQLNLEADLSSLIIAAQPTGGIAYDDGGIQTVLNAAKSSLQKAVTQRIIQQFNNGNFTYLNAAQVSAAKKSSGVYDDMSVVLTFLGRILRVGLNVELKV